MNFYNSSELESKIHSIIEKKRKEAMIYTQRVMEEAYNEISLILRNEPMANIHSDKINGISIDTLRFLHNSKDINDCSENFKNFLISEFIQAKHLGFQSMRNIYPQLMKRWTPEEDKLVIKEWNEGMSAKELSEILGRHPKSIVRRIEKLLTPNK